MNLGSHSLVLRFLAELTFVLPAWYVGLRLRRIEPLASRRRKGVIWLLIFAIATTIPSAVWALVGFGARAGVQWEALSGGNLLLLGESLLMHALLLAFIGLWMGMWTDYNLW